MGTESEVWRHPQRWFIALVGLLSAAAVAGAFFMSQGGIQKNKIVAQRSGALTLSANELVALVKSEKLVAYWLGPISGSKYTLVATDNGIVTITYLSGGSGIENPFQNNLVFETVADENLKAALVAPGTEIDNSNVKTVTGNTFSYDRYLTDHMTVKIKGKHLQVFVFYPRMHSVSSMQTDAEALLQVG